MSVNVEIFDRIARIVVGIIGVLPIVTALMGNCLAHSVFGVSTR